MHLRLLEFAEFGGDVEQNAVPGPRQSDPTDEEDEEHEVGICGGEVHHLGGTSMGSVVQQQPGIGCHNLLASQRILLNNHYLLEFQVYE